jgi:hypothetical protein
VALERPSREETSEGVEMASPRMENNPERLETTSVENGNGKFFVLSRGELTHL